jgi:hypothetical protein
MKKTLLAAAFVVAIASPALAQSYDPDIGSGNLDSQPYASTATYRAERMKPVHRRTVRRARPSEAYAHSPQGAIPWDPAYGYYGSGPVLGPHGYRWLGAKYDAYGYYIDPNDPDLW